MIAQALGFLLETALGLFLFAALLRFFMQRSGSRFGHPFTRFVIAITDFAVRPLRRVVPGLWGHDLASLVAAWIAAMLMVVGLDLLGVRPLPGDAPAPMAALGVLSLAFLYVLKIALYLIMGLVFIQAILSWVSPGSPAGSLLDGLTRPFLRPVQRRLPPVGGVDLSPLVVFVVCQLLLMLPVAALERGVYGMLIAF